jgi:hypothetical protein
MTVKKLRLGYTTLQDVIPCASVIWVRSALTKGLPLVTSVWIVPVGPLWKRRVAGKDPESGNHCITRVSSREIKGSSDAPLAVLTDLWVR